MKSFVFLFLLFTSFSAYSNINFPLTEVVIPGGTDVDIENALADLEGTGTITIKGDINLLTSVTIPRTVTLNIFNGNKFIISSNNVLTINGKIISGLHQIFNFQSLSSEVAIHNQEVYPEWFGICSYQNNLITDDRSTIQRAINSMENGLEIIFTGNYTVSGPINIDVEGIRIKGRGVYQHKSSGTPMPETNFIKNQSTESSPIFNISAFGVRVSDLNFRGAVPSEKGIDAKGKALRYVRGNGHKDLDASVTNCAFLNFHTAIYGEGANLKITENLFTASKFGIHIIEAQLNERIHKAQTRGHIIDRNRFHSMGSAQKHPSLIGAACIKIIHESPYTEIINPAWYNWTGHGYYNHITNNYADDCMTFFEGSVDRTKIDGNSILLSSDTAIKALVGSYGRITNNLIDGSNGWNPNLLYPNSESGEGSGSAFPKGHGIHVNHANHITIHNNTINNVRYHGIYIEKSKNSSIQSNSIMNFNRHAYVRPTINGTTVTVPTEDLKSYDGIHIDCTPRKGKELLNIQNIVSGNSISLPFSPLGSLDPVARYGIYIGDGDAWGFVKNNFIVTARMIQGVHIKTPEERCD